MYQKQLRLLAAMLLLSLLTMPICMANGGGYQRQAKHANMGRHHQFWPGHGPGFGGGFYSGFAVPQVYGSWYQRPYPYHFDYYRWRYSQPPLAPEYPCELGHDQANVGQPIQTAP